MKKQKIFYSLLLVICTLLSTTIVGILSIFTTHNIARKNAESILNLTCQNTCQQFDSSLKSIEQSVDTLASSAVFHIDDFERFQTDANYVDSYTETLRNHALETVNHTEGAMSIYIRYNPEFTSSLSGLYYVLDKEIGEFVSVPVTDLNNCTYEEATWYHIPVAEGKPTWMEPYDNNKIGYRMISYVVPYYIEGELVGVVGMDIDFEYLTKVIHDINIYDTGFAFLFSQEGKVIVHKDFRLYEDLSSSEYYSELLACVKRDPESLQHSFSSEEQTLTCMLTQNNMFLALSVPSDEIYKDSSTLTKVIVFITLFSFFIIFLLTLFITKKIFRLAEIDELTGIFNRKYFLNYYQEMDMKKLHEHTLFIFDIDKFKQVNDSYGHNNGDLAIRHVAQLAKSTLGNQAVVARWGGDEFIGLLPTDKAFTLLDMLRKKVADEDSSDYGKITISIGIADTGKYQNFHDTLDSADSALYLSKAKGRNRISGQ